MALDETLENWAGDYEVSFAATQLPDAVRNHVGAILRAFLEAVKGRDPDFPERVSPGTFAYALEHAVALDLPGGARRAAAEAIAGFFEFMQTSGRLGEGVDWAAQVRVLGSGMRPRVRVDGKVMGVTHQRPAAAVGRNDPCPCGSGKKYKKCCGG